MVPKRKQPSGFTSRLKPEPRSRTLVVRLSSSLHERLTAAAEKNGVTRSKFVREAIIHGLEQLE
jgi:predicted DNA-binding protein